MKTWLKLIGSASNPIADDPKDDPDYNQNTDGSCRWKLPVRYSINLPVAAGILIDDVRCSRDLRLSVRQASHVGLRADESQLADRKLQEADRKFQEKQSA